MLFNFAALSTLEQVMVVLSTISIVYLIYTIARYIKLCIKVKILDIQINQNRKLQSLYDQRKKAIEDTKNIVILRDHFPDDEKERLNR